MVLNSLLEAQTELFTGGLQVVAPDLMLLVSHQTAECQALVVVRVAILSLIILCVVG